MTNGNDVARAKHLESAAINVKRYILNEILDLAEAVAAEFTGGAVLDSVPATVDGGLWYETTSTAPIIKILQGGSTYYLYTNQLVSPNLTLSSSTVTATSGTSQTVTLTYSGNGSITLSNPNASALTATYNSSTKTITLTSNVAAGSSATVSLGISLSESGNYAADSQTLTVTCQGALANPNLKVTPAAITISGGVVGNPSTGTATVSYAGSGTVTVTPSSNLTDVSYNSSTKVITVSNYGNDQTGTVAVSLSAAGNYSAASTSLSVTKQSFAPVEEEFEIEINGEPINLEDHSAEVAIAEPDVQLYIAGGSDAEVVITDGDSNEIVFEQDGDIFAFVMETATATVQISKEGFYTATVTIILE